MAVQASPPASGFGTGRLFLADSRMALAVGNDVRHRAVRRFFGVPPEHSNLLSAILALSAAGAAYDAGRQMLRVPASLNRRNAAVGGFMVREATLGIGGAPSREIPNFGTLLTIALVGGVALPELRRASRSISAAEQRVRQRRIALYTAARRTVLNARPGGS